MFQPVPGLYEQGREIDFTSLYPSIIVASTSPPRRSPTRTGRGSCPRVLAPLLALRKESKARKAADPSYAGIDALLKWMLVTCFGYTGYKNAKFGQIEVHEKITGHAREILLTAKECAEEMGFARPARHRGLPLGAGGISGPLKVRVEEKTGLHTTLDCYDWIVFLPMPDGFGAYNRYYGRLGTGELKVRGIMARRGDTPPYVRAMQDSVLSVMQQARTRAELAAREDEVRRVYREADDGLPDAPPSSMAIRRQVSRLRLLAPVPGSIGGCGMHCCRDRGWTGDGDWVRGDGCPDLVRGTGLACEALRPGVLQETARKSLGGDRVCLCTGTEVNGRTGTIRVSPEPVPGRGQMKNCPCIPP